MIDNENGWNYETAAMAYAFIWLIGLARPMRVRVEAPCPARHPTAGKCLLVWLHDGEHLAKQKNPQAEKRYLREVSVYWD